MTDLTQPATPQEFIAAGATPDQAAVLATQANVLAGRAGPEARAAATYEANTTAPVAPPAEKGGYVTPEQASAALAEHEQAQLAGHLEQVFAAPASHLDYKIPPTSGQYTEEARVADGALTQLFHAERMPKYIGESLMMDLQRGQFTEKSPEAVTALRPFLQEMLYTARRNPALAPFVEGASADRLLSALSPETVIALMPFVTHRANRR